jgi:Na+/melibiose symporter-like transporter
MIGGKKMGIKGKKQYPLDARSIFGLSTMRWTVVAGSSLMTSAFMLYLTDYSGLANAAAIATMLLAFGRILDALDDPLQGWIMDNSKKTRIGKLKPFMLGGIVVTAIAMIMLFNMPANTTNGLKLCTYLLVIYCMRLVIHFSRIMQLSHP